MNDGHISSSYAEELASWRYDLDQGLKKEDGWLALSGLFWLQEGDNSFGTDPENDFVLSVAAGQERIGNFRLENGEVTVSAQDGVDLLIDGEKKTSAVLEPDSSGAPTVIKLDHLTFMLLEREDGLAIRLWDNLRPERLEFEGRRWLPVDEESIVRGIYQPYQREKEMVFSRKNGADFATQVQGEVQFEIDGESYALVAFKQDNGALFTMFHDLTSGVESYPSGRYLLIDPPDGDRVTIDFNRAYNPPCAFTDYATCSLPPAQNRIQARILAGESL